MPLRIIEEALAFITVVHIAEAFTVVATIVVRP